MESEKQNLVPLGIGEAKFCSNWNRRSKIWFHLESEKQNFVPIRTGEAKFCSNSNRRSKIWFQLEPEKITSEMRLIAATTPEFMSQYRQEILKEILRKDFQERVIELFFMNFRISEKALEPKNIKIHQKLLNR